MATASQKATARQLAYIKNLCVEVGEPVPEFERNISSLEASQIIGDLIAKSQKGTFNGNDKQLRINEPRLGMAIKECFRLYTGLGMDIWSEKKEYFVRKVLETYLLFTEAVNQVDQHNNTD